MGIAGIAFRQLAFRFATIHLGFFLGAGGITDDRRANFSPERGLFPIDILMPIVGFVFLWLS